MLLIAGTLCRNWSTDFILPFGMSTSSAIQLMPVRDVESARRTRARVEQTRHASSLVHPLSHISALDEFVPFLRVGVWEQ